MKTFQKASKKQARLRMCIAGLSGAGKTYTALQIACQLGRVAVIDTERGSASKYAGQFEFDVLELESHSPEEYGKAIKAAVEAGCYDVLVIDSLSHSWAGVGGALEQVDDAKARSGTNNGFAGWKEVTPKWNKFVDALLRVPMHVIGTMRQKTEYVMETNERGKTAPKKVGLAPVFREGGEYEFDIVALMDRDHNLIIEKSRCSPLQDKVFHKPSGEDLAIPLSEWLNDGVDGWAMTGEMVDSIMKYVSGEKYSNADIKLYLSLIHGVEIKVIKDFYSLSRPQYEALMLAMANDTLADEVLGKAPPTTPEPTEAEKELELV